MATYAGMDEARIAQLFQKFLTQELGKEEAKPKLRDLWVRYEAWATTVTDGGRPRIKSWKTHGHVWARHVLPWWGDLDWDACTVNKADEYRVYRGAMISERTKRPLKAATMNRELRGVQACLSWSCKRGYIPRNPMVGLQDEREIHDRDFAITQEQFLALVEQARPLLQQFLVMLYETGCRRDEIRCLEWSEVNLEAGVIELPWHRTKAARDRTITLSTVAQATLERIPVFKGVPYVFANPFTGQGPITKSTLSDWLIEARTAAKVTGPKGQPVWYHTLRHTWSTDMSAMGLPMALLMSMGGWADLKTARIYQNFDSRHAGAVRGPLDARSEPITKALHGGAKGPRGTKALHLVQSEDKGEGKK